jgi:hypothetical protein
MGYTSALQSGNFYITAQAWKCGTDPNHTDFFEKSGTCPKCGQPLVLVQNVQWKKQYLLVSPGPDRRYGYVYKAADGGIVPDTAGTATGTTCDDIWYAR